LQANLSGKSLELYQHTWERVLGGLPSELDVKYIYLQTKVDTIVERMQTRGREAEAGVPREYLETLDKNHEDFIWEDTVMHAIIDGDRDQQAVWKDICAALKEWVTEIGEDLSTTLDQSGIAPKQASELRVMVDATRYASSRLEAESLSPGPANKRVCVEDAIA